MKDVVNRVVKFREPFRPFAPSLLEESVNRYFDSSLEGQSLPNFMLRTAQVRPDARADIPATTHVDGSARPQVVSKRWNSLFHKLISAFGNFSGHPVLLNTSFNVKGEPIVATPSDAVATLAHCGLDAAYVENFRIAKQKEVK